jgi:hypothetical protein
MRQTVFDENRRVKKGLGAELNTDPWYLNIPKRHDYIWNIKSNRSPINYSNEHQRPLPQYSAQFKAHPIKSDSFA